MESFELAKQAANLLDEKKAEHISVIKIDDISSLADYFVIATGRGETHVHSLSDELDEKLKAQGAAPARIEGYRSNSWILLEARDFYDLDRLWADGARVEWADQPEG